MSEPETRPWRPTDAPGLTQWWSGKMEGLHEVVSFGRAISEDERHKLEGYLAHKHGVSLPKSHPYYVEPPRLTHWQRVVRFVRRMLRMRY